MQLRRRIALIAATTAIATFTAPEARAQSAYVPLDDVAYVYVDALLARGQLRDLSALERPYTVRAITDALAADSRAMRAAEARPAIRAAVRRVMSRRAASRRAAFPPPVAALRAGLEQSVAKYGFSGRARGPVRAEMSAGLWITGETSGQRELMRADDLGATAFAGGAARFLMTAGPVVAFSRPILDNRLNTDPDFSGPGDRSIAGRMEDAYVAGQWRYGELFFGRVARNWGPAPLQGLLLSDAPYTYDHLFGRLGGRRVNLQLLHARLENHGVGTGREESRYLASHRLALRWRWIEAAIAESYLYTGVGRGFEPSLANPVNIYGLTWRNEGQEGNLLVTGQLAARTRLGLYSAEVMIDDIQIDRCDPECDEPSSFGVTFTAEGIPLPLGQRAFGSYTRVSSLTYRTPNPSERYTMFDVSLGRAFSDYDEWRIGADVVLGGAPLRPYFAYARQGAGDYRSPFPPPEDYATHPVTFEQPVSRVRRLGVSGGRVFGAFDARGDVGYNWRSTPGAAATAGNFEGRVRVAWNPAWARWRLQ